MKDTSSFSLVMTNLFVGLCRGHRFLHPVSDQARALGYKLFRIEPSFAGTIRQVRPDAIACSSRRRHTLLGEWTGMDSMTPEKRLQVRAYMAVTRKELVDLAAVDVDSAESSSTWLVVRPEAAGAFGVVLEKMPGGKLLLSTLGVHDNSGYRLACHGGALADDELTGLLTGPHTFRRVPMSYVRFSFDDLSPRAIAAPVVQEIVSLVAKEAYKFTIVGLCSDLFDGAWKQIATEVQNSVARAVRKVVKELSSQEYASDWLAQVPGERDSWALNVGRKADASSFLSQFRDIAERFLARLANRPFTPELPFDE